jgi:hypothetical protein
VWLPSAVRHGWDLLVIDEAVDVGQPISGHLEASAPEAGSHPPGGRSMHEAQGRVPEGLGMCRSAFASHRGFSRIRVVLV